MSFLLDHGICTGYLRNHQHVVARVNQHGGRFHLSALSIIQIERWILGRVVPQAVVQGYVGFLNTVHVVNVDEEIAHRAVMLGRALRRQGHVLDVFDLVTSATALERGLDLVTHDPTYQVVPGLTVHDWTLP